MWVSLKGEDPLSVGYEQETDNAVLDLTIKG
jgi:hypothetical protein